MRSSNSKLLRVAVVMLMVSAIAQAQSHEAQNTFSARLGGVVISLPPPPGYEEVSSKFESMKARFVATEAPQNDLLAAFLPTSDCDLLRQGQQPLFNQYAKISVLKKGRELTITDPIFESIIGEFRKDGIKILDPKSERIKLLFKGLEERISRLDSQETKLELSQQPESLGEFDVRANVFGVMLLMNLNAEIEGKKTTIPILTSTGFLRIRQRVIFVYGFVKYRAPADVESLKDLSKKWYDLILRAN